MSEKSKQLREMLFNKKENGVDFMSAEELALCDEFCEGYKAFLAENKTEREIAAWVEKVAQNNGFQPFDAFGDALEAGDKVYYANRGKSIILCVKGKRSIKDGVRISAAHIDSPRLDLKQCPVYEQEELAVNAALVSQYLQDGEIAEDFALYYDLFSKYHDDYKIGDILQGTVDATILRRARMAPFDERIALVNLLLDAISTEVHDVEATETALRELRAKLEQDMA